MIPEPVLGWANQHRHSVRLVESALETLVAALARNPLETLRSGRAFRLVVDYDEDQTREGYRMRTNGTFVLRGGSHMLRIDMRPSFFASDRPALVRIDEPCPPGRRVSPDAASISARAMGMLDAMRRPRPDPDGRRQAVDHVVRILEAGFAACVGTRPAGSPFARMPGPWESFPYVSTISRRGEIDPPHFMFGETRTGTIHPDLERMMRELPGPHARIHVREDPHRRGGPTWRFVVEPDTHVRFAPPSEVDVLTAMRTLAGWLPDDGRPPLELAARR